MADRALLRNRRICFRTTRAVEAAVREFADTLHMNRSQMVHWLVQAEVHNAQYHGTQSDIGKIVLDQLTYESYDLFKGEVDKALATYNEEDVPW